MPHCSELLCIYLTKGIPVKLCAVNKSVDKRRSLSHSIHKIHDTKDKKNVGHLVVYRPQGQNPVKLLERIYRATVQLSTGIAQIPCHGWLQPPHIQCK